MGLLGLPNELLLAIIVQIGGFDILPCRLICKRVQELIDQSLETQLSIELASEGLSVAPWDDAPASTLLDRLARSREAWKTLQPTHRETIPLRGDIYLTYEVCGYMFAQGKPIQTGSQLIDDDPFRTRTLEFWEMPIGGTAVEGECNRGWHRKYEDVGMDFVDFTFDPSQDALILVEKQGPRYIFHLRTISGNLNHPDAKMIEMATEGPLELARCDLQIRDRYIVAHIVSQQMYEVDVFTMWDWKSGECVLYETHVGSYTFLDSCTPLLVIRMEDGIAFTTGSLRRPQAKSKYLIFPKVASSTAHNHSTTFHDSKLPRPESYPSTSASFSRSTIPAIGDHGVVALSISSFDFNHGGPLQFLVFFLREALARIFRQELTLEDGEEERYVDWTNWGPDVSRWFRAPSFDQWRCSVHGYRFVTLVTRFEALTDISPNFPSVDISTDDDPGSTLHLLVFDFNPYPLRRHCSSIADSSKNAVVIAPFDVTFHDQEKRFEENIVGRLACRITLMEEPADYAAVLVCEDNVLGIQTVSGENDTGGLAHIRVLTF